MNLVGGVIPPPGLMLKSDMSSSITTFYYSDDRCLSILQISLSPASSSNRAPSGERIAVTRVHRQRDLKNGHGSLVLAHPLKHWRSRSRDRPGLPALTLNS